MEQKLFRAGLLKGLADKRLAPLLLALHQSPEQAWSLEAMAENASMSKASFSATFKEIMGGTPMEYLTHWRITVVQHLLQQGLPVAIVAEKSVTAITRV